MNCNKKSELYLIWVMKWAVFQCFPLTSRNVLLLQHWQCGQNAWKIVLYILFLFKLLSQEIPEIFSNCSGTCFWLKRTDRPQLLQHISISCVVVFFPLTIIIFSASNGWVGEDSCIWRDFYLCKPADIPGDRSEEVLVCSLRIVAHKKHSCHGCAFLV